VEEERRGGTKGYELEQEYSQEETKGRRRCRCGEKICSAGVPLFRALGKWAQSVQARGVRERCRVILIPRLHLGKEVAQPRQELLFHNLSKRSFFIITVRAAFS